MKIFCYGTLKRGHRAHNFLEDHNAKFLQEAKTHSRYHLYKLGWYPGMIIDESVEGGVQGELYEIEEDCIIHLDRYEGAPDLFRREEIELNDGSKVISYIYMKDVTPSSAIKEGIWE